MAEISTIPPPRTPFLDDRTGLVSREWYRWFYVLFQLTGEGTNDTSLSDIQLGPPTADQSGELLALLTESRLAAMIAAFEQQATQFLQDVALSFQSSESVGPDDLLSPSIQVGTLSFFNVDGSAGQAPVSDGAGGINWTTVPASSAATAPSGITVGSSPFSYQNTQTYPVDVIVSGGGVSQLEFSRDGATWYDTGSYYGLFGLSPSDQLRVTYTAAPTMTLIPR